MTVMHNQRDVSASLRATVNSSASSELFVTFVTITHPRLARIIRVVCEADGNISFANGKPVNYKLGGELFLAVPFSVSWLSDGENPAEARASIPAIDREIGDEIRSLIEPPQLRMQVAKSSDFDILYDEDNARNPYGTPTIESDAKYLFLRDVQGSGVSISGRIARFDMGKEPYPPQRALKRNAPALYI